MLPIRHVLAPVDLTSISSQAVDAAIELAETFQARLTLLHVFNLEMTPLDPLLQRRRAEIALQHLLKEVRRRVPLAYASVVEGAPSKAILQAVADECADVIVMATHGRHGVDRLLLGSVAEQVLRSSPVPVLVIGGEVRDRAQDMRHALEEALQTAVAQTSRTR